jgi:hypothetical protein
MIRASVAERAAPREAALWLCSQIGDPARHIGDFTRWKNHDAYTKALDWLLRDLRVETG